MNHDTLMRHACQIMLPVKYRETILDIFGENKPIPAEDAEYFIAYHKKLDKIIVQNDNSQLLKKLIKDREKIYEHEFNELDNLCDKELSLISGLIEIEKSTRIVEGHA